MLGCSSGSFVSLLTSQSCSFASPRCLTQSLDMIDDEVRLGLPASRGLCFPACFVCLCVSVSTILSASHPHTSLRLLSARPTEQNTRVQLHSSLLNVPSVWVSPELIMHSSNSVFQRWLEDRLKVPGIAVCLSVSDPVTPRSWMRHRCPSNITGRTAASRSGTPNRWPAGSWALT